MHLLVSFIVGLVFGLGLIISGMTNPTKVQNFLDLTGTWDPSLMFVMGGAILVGFFAFGAARHRTANFLGGTIQLPSRQDINRPLVMGSVMFGMGWGLAGMCPGPALVSMAAGHWEALVFVLAMLVGMWGQQRVANLTSANAQATSH